MTTTQAPTTQPVFMALDHGRMLLASGTLADRLPLYAVELAALVERIKRIDGAA